MRKLFLGLGVGALVVGLALGLMPWGTQEPNSRSEPGDSAAKPSESEFVPKPGEPWFEEVSRSAGVDFVHDGAATPRHLIQETMGSGIAWIDYDRDGWVDLFCVQVGSGERKGTHRLYRNQGDGTFRDVSEQVGVAFSSYGMGAEVGDFDNDGFDDLLVSSLDGVRLLHNQPGPAGGRRFVDVTERSGIANPHWATSCAWGDVDNDGWLDLYIANYVEVNRQRPLECRDYKTGLAQSCTPHAYPHVQHRLFRNRRDGTFEDVSRAWGIAETTAAPGLGVVLVDLDDDGHLDIYVANDMKPAYLFHNTGKGRFVEKAIPQGCGLGRNGSHMAGMGVVAADLDGSGRMSLFVTNFQYEPNVLFLNRGQLLFDEYSHPSGLGLSSLQRLGFGAVALDVDHDGLLDLAVVNGHVNRFAEEISGATYAQAAQLFLGTGKGRFRDVSEEAGSYFRRREVGRGLAAADYDNDGLVDLAISNNGGPVVLLRNRTANGNHRLSLKLEGDGQRSNSNAIGARVEIFTREGRQVRTIVGGGSYLSSSDRRVNVGLGKATEVQRVKVRWPSGRKQEYESLTSDRAYLLVEGRTEAVLLKR